jgi:hypothetical protein
MIRGHREDQGILGEELGGVKDQQRLQVKREV